MCSKDLPQSFTARPARGHFEHHHQEAAARPVRIHRGNLRQLWFAALSGRREQHEPVGRRALPFNGAFENRDSFRDFGFNERTFVAPSVSWVVDRDTVVTWEGEYLYDRRRSDSGLIAVNGDSRVFPVNRYFVIPATDACTVISVRPCRSRTTSTTTGRGTWAHHAVLRCSGTITNPTAGFLGPAPGQFYTGGLLNRQQNVAQRFAEQNHALIANLYGEFDTVLGRIIWSSVPNKIGLS